MILYHLDRSGTLDPCGTISHVPISEIPESIKELKLFSCLGGQLSHHGINYLSLNCRTSGYLPCPDGSAFYRAEDVAWQIENANMHMMELTFEMVRKAYFPQHPSRFSSLFAVDDLQNFHSWPELCRPEDLGQANIFKLEISDNCPRFDSTWLRGGLIHGQSSGTFHIAYACGFCFDFAYNYWSQVPSDNPRWEYLIPLPIDSASISRITIHPETYAGHA